MKIILKIWREGGDYADGRFVIYPLDEPSITEEFSLLELLDLLNEKLVAQSQSPVAFEHDCREGICGSCGMMVNGYPHGPHTETSVCQLHLRSFQEGDTIILEPFRAKAFPIIRDLMCDRTAFDRIIQAGGYVSVNVGQAQDANSIAVPKDNADEAMDAATCIGCGACVAACPNASAMLFTAAKVSHLALLPQGEPETRRRAQAMISQMDREGFGSCSNTTACEAECPKGISIKNITRLNQQYLRATFT
ncbi:MAG: succinate dehydrogenase/fumarate reductase iron-sulfur subunit [Cyanobacteria bacterium P01_H01_bin.15]